VTPMLGHQGDACRARAQGGQDVADAAVVDVLRSNLAGPVRAVCEHDGIDSVYRGNQCVGAGHVTDDDLRLRGKPSSLVGITHQGTSGVPLPDRLGDNEASDAACCADDQHGRGSTGHGCSWLVSAITLGVTSSMTRSAWRVHG
jgi:hypothetical protein